MNEYKNDTITPFNLMCILISIMFGLNATKLANSMVNIAKQDGWISAGVGAIYPLYVSIIAMYISGKYPNDNILIVSKKYVGNTMGNILNFLFFLSIFVYIPAMISNASITMRTYIVNFMTNMQIYVSLMLLGAYLAYKGLNVVSKICIVNFYIIIVIILFSLLIIKNGSILNVMPIFSVKFTDILKGSSSSIYDYGGMEVILLIYPFLNDKRQIGKTALKTTFLICFIYTWIVFITIYYLGIDIIPKTIWSFFTATESIRLEVVNSFRYFFIFLWVLIMIKSVGIFYYVCIFILSDINKKFSSKLTYIGIGIITIFFAYNYLSEKLLREKIVDYVIKFTTAYSLCYITLIAMLIFIKGRKK